MNPSHALPVLVMVASTAAFHTSSVFVAHFETKTRMGAASLVIYKSFDSSDALIYDTLGLYPRDCAEHLNGRISALEPNVKVLQSVIDHMKLYLQEYKIDEPMMS